MRQYDCPFCDRLIRTNSVSTLITSVAGHLKKHVREGKITEYQFMGQMMKAVARNIKKK